MVLRRLTSSTSCVLCTHAVWVPARSRSADQPRPQPGTGQSPAVQVPSPGTLDGERRNAMTLRAPARTSFRAPTAGQRNWTMRANSSGSRLAPPTRAPSMSGWAISSAMFDAFTEPPYWMRTARRRRPRPVELADARPDGRAHRLGVLGGGRPAGADRPDRLVGDDQRGDLVGGAPGQRRRRPGRGPWPRCRPPRAPPASRRRRRSASSRGAGSPCALSATISSVSPNSSRRSLWPQITYSHVELGQERRRHLAGEGALVLPVAVLGAEQRTAACRRRSTSGRVRRSVNGGWMLTSTSSVASLGSR